MAGQILSIGQAHRDDLVREQIESAGTFTDVLDAVRTSRASRFVALLGLEEGHLTHAALGVRGGRVATGKVRVRYNNIRRISPVALRDVHEGVAPSLRRHLSAGLSTDGWLPEQTWNAALDVIRRDPRNERVLTELETQIANRPPASIGPSRLRVLQEERDALGLALEIFDPRLKNQLPGVSALEATEVPFAVAMSEAELNEDIAIAHDTRVFDGWLPRDAPALGAMRFVSRGNSLTVANVNRTRVERVLGVDLLYFHATYRSFVFVQYKRMERDDQNRPYYRPAGRAYKQEMTRMAGWDAIVREGRDAGGLPDYRLGTDAFFFKIYHNPLGSPPPTGLLQGMYFPLSYWTRLVKAPSSRGPRGGVRVTYENASRHFTNTQFAELVGDGWVGSALSDEALLTRVIGEALDARHSLTIAIEERR